MILICVILLRVAAAQQVLPPVGLWREHLPYNSSIDVAAIDDKIFAATPYSLFSVNLEDDAVKPLSKVTGLSETGISRIYADAGNKKLLVAYSNSNIDIIEKNDIHNIPAIKRSTFTGDKTIYHIFGLENNYYLSTGFGIVVIDGSRHEVKDTWNPGDGGNPVKVNATTADASFFYAATASGLKKVPRFGLNLADPANWQLISGNGLSGGIVSAVMNISGKIIIQKNDSLFYQTTAGWSFLYSDGWPVINTNLSENKLLLSERKANGNARLVILNADGTVSRIISNSGAISYPQKALIHKNKTWVADLYAALSAFGSTDTYRSYKINSPLSVASGQSVVVNNVFYTTAGSVNESWNYQYNADGIYTLKEGRWTNYNRYGYAQLDSLLDFITIAVDKTDGSAWAGSFGGGLVQIRPGPAFRVFKQNYLGETVGDPGSYRVAGLAFDRDNNLWIANYGAAQQLKVRKADGTWKGFSVPPPLYDNAVGQIVIDNNNYKWIVAPLGSGLIVYDHGNSIDNTADDRWKRFSVSPSNGNLPSNEVLSIEKDKKGFIWVGTSDGIGVFECTEEVFTAKGCNASWPLVPNGNFAGYLFKGQQVRSIITDGANRKWVATKNGVFLVSEDGLKVVYHFTEANSPLHSNDVRQVAIDGTTGEVFFSTQKGIISFRSPATDAGETKNEVIVFPNPVPAGFSGTIAVRGVPENAIVKITELDGRLVFQTRALGGQAVWDGKNYKGQTISSGVYLVLISDGKKETLATKIFFIQKG